MLINKNIHIYSASIQDPVFNDGNIFTLKNDLCYGMVFAKLSSILIYKTTYRIYRCISRVSGTRLLDKISGVDLYTGNVFGHVAAELN